MDQGEAIRAQEQTAAAMRRATSNTVTRHGMLIMVYGNTFDCRQRLKDLRLTWDRNLKCWKQFYMSTPAAIEMMAELRRLGLTPKMVIHKRTLPRHTSFFYGWQPQPWREEADQELRAAANEGSIARSSIKPKFRSRVRRP